MMGTTDLGIQRTRRGVEIWVGLTSIKLPHNDRCRPRLKKLHREVGAEGCEFIFMCSCLREGIGVLLRKERA